MARVCTLLLFDILLIALGIKDFKEKKISNRCQIMILLLALVALLTMPEITVKMRLAGMLIVSVPMALAETLLPGSFGGGDIKLVFSCGAFLGWKLMLMGTAAAIYLAGIYSLWQLLAKGADKKMQFAMGPYFSGGFILSSLALL